jgi:hypothetical protein
MVSLVTDLKAWMVWGRIAASTLAARVDAVCDLAAAPFLVEG